jgi:glycosyltransferase involved in cell wall biosynthesis
VPRERLSESLSSGDVHVVSQSNGTLGLLEPSKLYGAMAVGRPVLFIGPAGGEAAITVARERLGEVVAPGDVDGAVAALERLLGDDQTGPRARAAFERGYDRPVRTAQLAGIFESARLEG